MTIEIHPKAWGREEWLVNAPLYCGKLLFLDRGKRCSLHFHRDKDETFYILKGRVLMELDNKENVMESGESKRIVPMAYHRFSGLEDSVIIEFSTHHEEEDSYRVYGESSGDVPKEIMFKYWRKTNKHGEIINARLD